MFALQPTKPYFYTFLEPLSKELAYVARELENSIFTSPRTMLTHARTFVETILEKVIVTEQLPFEPYMSFKERLDLLNDNGYLTDETRNALHHVRMIGNKAAHDVRRFRYSEALLSWESIYTIVKWYIEVYYPIDTTVPDYQDPQPDKREAYDMAELEVRLKNLEVLLTASMRQDGPVLAQQEAAATVVSVAEQAESPGFTTIRKITYKGRELDVPYFLRDAFLLPQRFDKSERFLIALGAHQEARIMSELPNNLEGLSDPIPRYSEKNDENLFEELNCYIEEEKVRRKLILERPGELFFFYKADHIVVTEELSKIPFTAEEFKGITSLLRQLNEDQIETVGQLPKELVILAKYKNVGVGTVEKLFEQLVGKQSGQ